jgi:sulfotransferase family protein
MSRPLDFIVYGIARSGTKGLVRALNLHPDVYCGMERFYFRADHTNLTFPESFLDPSNLPDPADRRKLETVRQELATKTSVRFAGNKLPRYFFALDRINREIPALKNIWIYRSPYAVLPSWDRRELDNRKGQWPAGQVGLFALIELLVCVENSLALPKDVLVFPYDPGLSRSDGIVRQALAFLGADPELYDGLAFGAGQKRKQAKQALRAGNGASRQSLSDGEAELLEALRIKDLDRIFNQDQALMLSAIVGPLRDYLEDITPALPGALDAAFAATENASVPSFGRDYVRRYRGELAGLLRRANGSGALAGFGCYGAYDRLKSLYVQRWRLKRKLLAMRP